MKLLNTNFLAVLFFILSQISHAYQLEKKESFIDLFLASYNSGSQDVIKEFIVNNYQPKVADSTVLVNDISISFSKLYDQFGQLELHSKGYDSTYKSPLYYLRGTYSKQWVTLLIVPTSDKNKILGHGLWKFRAPPGYEEKKLNIKNASLYLEDYMNSLAEANLFSGSVLIANSDKILFQGSYGDGINSKSQFELASVTKMFTASAIYKLALKSKLKLSDSIGKWVKQYPADISDQVTIEHLLLHTSGIELDDNRNYVNKSRFSKSLTELINLQVLYLDSMNEGRRTNFKPLNEYDYTNEGYDLLGYIVEQASELPFDKYIEQEVCSVIGLKSTTFKPMKRVVGITHYKDVHYTYVPGDLFNNVKFNEDYSSPSGGLYSTPLDLWMFFKALNSGELLGHPLEKTLLNKRISTGAGEYGFGIRKFKEKGYSILGHNGGSPGVSTIVNYLPDIDTYIIILSNRDEAAGLVLEHIISKVSF